jgi:hypothetical protein
MARAASPLRPSARVKRDPADRLGCSVGIRRRQSIRIGGAKHSIPRADPKRSVMIEQQWSDLAGTRKLRLPGRWRIRVRKRPYALCSVGDPNLAVDTLRQ